MRELSAFVCYFSRELVWWYYARCFLETSLVWRLQFFPPMNLQRQMAQLIQLGSYLQ